ncbi:complement C1q subcomponent subunit B-like [Littorina saxatilis]|uniref:complement C1q subcomponent subunit B-like n=1 Tax=Littorina saxatilis TaxID=31220 RepID=UPI0038B54E1C
MPFLQLRVLSTGLLVLILWSTSSASLDVAFSAGSTKHLLLRPGQKLVYNRVYTNVGSALNAGTGVFTCPQSGLYLFNVFALTTRRKHLKLELHQNSRYIMSLYANANGSYGTGGNSVILRVNKGDTVYVSARETSSLYGQPPGATWQGIYTTFTGYLISPVLRKFPKKINRNKQITK